MGSPTVSVLLISYNQAAFLPESIESVIRQTYQDWELILIDNGSTDASPTIIDKYRSHPKVRVIRYEHNRPVTVIWNIGVAQARGKYWSLLPSDDLYLPEKLERQVAAFEDLPEEYGVVYSPGYRLDSASGRRWLDRTLKVSGSILKEMFTRQDEGFINPISPLVRRQCLVDYPCHEDLFFEGESIYWRIAMTYKFQYLDEPLVVMREHPGNRGRAIKLNAKMVLTVFEKLSQEPDFPRDLVVDLDRFRGNFMGMCGWLGVRAGEPRWARDCFASAIRWYPKQLFRGRTLAGLALCTLPAGVSRTFNRALNKVMGHKEAVAFKTDYS